MKKIQGIVTSTKNQDTATVRIERWVAHPLYGKRLRRHKKYHADNMLGTAVGDKVLMVQTKPMSKTKMWRIVEIVK
ncbi:30S ribosomal protein S17 [Candidatus Microgenomates bacterium]|nr:30S ribosomal protein S17 [Candidatus Microgenomates bacterium]